MTELAKVVAIDGPSGGGKSTIAQLISHKLGILYVDTGAMFRALGYYFHHKGLLNHHDQDDDGEFSMEKSLTSELIHLRFVYGKSSECLVEINGVNLTQEIRQHHISELASKISKLTIIRDFLQDVQRSLAQEKVCVMEGRDIGTVIFPQSFCKVYLTASLETRALRRFKELEERAREKGQGHSFNLTLEEVKKDIEARDYRDMNRAVAPLKQADDAYLLDSTHLTADEVVQVLEEHIRFKASQVGIKI